MESLAPGPPSLPYFEEQSKKDDEHLKLLAIFHHLVGALVLLCIGFLVLHYYFMSKVFLSAMENGGPKAPHIPPEIMTVMRVMYLFFGALLLAMGAANIMNGIFLAKKKHRLFSIVVSGCNCLHFPLGTTLGVFTLVVLMRPSVKQAYEISKDSTSKRLA